MAATSSHPDLAIARWNRKAGRYDFNRFDDVSSSAACVGYKSIGKVNVDCSFLFKKSRWGILGDGPSPAGIIYMDINFDQPRDCKLASATIRVTLEQEGPLQPKQDLSSPFDSSVWMRPVQHTQWYGPKHIGGMPRKMLIKNTMHLTPNINILGNGAGGVGVNRERAFEHTSKWTFTGSLQPGQNDRSATYKSLKWVLEENELAKYPVHSNKIHTAFAFESNGKPFIMKVHISGRLRKLGSRLMLKMKPGPKDIPATLVGDHRSYKQPLDELARGLERAMELENYNSVPLELPEAQAATFYPAPQQVPGHGDTILEGGGGTNGALPALAQATPNQPQILIEGFEPSSLLAERAVGRREDAVDPTLEALARFGCGSYFHTPIRRPPTPGREDFGEDRSEISSQSSKTLVNSQAGEDDDGDEAASQSGGLHKPSAAGIDQEMVARLMEFAAVRLLIQFMILFGLVRSGPGDPHPGDEGDSNTRQARARKGAGQRLSPPQRQRLDGQRRSS